MKPIRILIIDDHTLFRSGVSLLLKRQAGFEVVGEAGDSLEDVVLLDLHMPGTSGLEAIPLLKDEAPESEIIMLTVSEDTDCLLEALQAGARGYLLKNIETDFLVDSIRRAVAGESIMSQQMTSRLADAMRSTTTKLASAENGLGKLTPREREIIIFLAHGDSNKKIARTLDLAESTVKIHVQGILRKLNLSSRVQAAVFAVENNLVTDK
jgi:two-component system, NarL family, nitrate/nitrite response regulator NarL